MDVEFLLMKAVGGRTMFGNAGFKHFENKKNTKKEKKKIQTPMRWEQIGIGWEKA